MNQHNVHWLLCRASVKSGNVRLEIYDSMPSGGKEFAEEVVHTVSTLLNDAFPQLANTNVRLEDDAAE